MKMYSITPDHLQPFFGVKRAQFLIGHERLALVKLKRDCMAVPTFTMKGKRDPDASIMCRAARDARSVAVNRGDHTARVDLRADRVLIIEAASGDGAAHLVFLRGVFVRVDAGLERRCHR